MCSKLLHDFLVWECLSKGTHIFEVSRRKASHFRKITPEVRCQAINHAGSLTFRCLAGEDVTANAPAEHDQFLVDSNGRPEPSRSDSFLELCE